MISTESELITDPFNFLVMPKLTQQFSEEVCQRFWKSVSKDGPVHEVCGQCWVWTNPLWGDDQYARIRVNGTRELVHRVSWQIHYGDIPDGLCVLHRCDNTICVNPDHLFLGTYSDNNWDKSAKGRYVSCFGASNGAYTHPECRPRGESHGVAVLTEDLVISLRRRYIPRHHKHGTNAIARELGMSQYAIWAAITGRTWKHVA